MHHLRSLRLAGLIAAAFLVAACEPTEDRVKRHYQSALSLLEEGDVDRALVELRNVFDLDGAHYEARRLYASTVRAQGNAQDAYSQYLRLVEQLPEDADARLALAEMAFVKQDWSEFDRHAPVAIEFDGDNPRARIVKVGLDYRQAVIDEDDPTRQAAGNSAAMLFAELNANQDVLRDSVVLRNVLVDSYIRDGRLSSALDVLDHAIAADPENRSLYQTRLSVLGRLQDSGAIEAQLRDMVAQFPEDTEIKTQLVRFYVGTGATDAAETFLRDVSDPGDEDPGLYLALLRFLLELRGPEAALAELETAVAAYPDAIEYSQARARLIFKQGEHSTAIEDLQSLIANQDEVTPELRDVKVVLAQMLRETRNDVGARRLIEEVLAEDTTHVEALKMRATFLITADEVDEAIAVLRTALDQEPRNFSAMTLMAEAYTRAGNGALARDFLALAVEASNNAPDETLRYAGNLIQDERYLPAEDTLIQALRLAPNNVELLAALAQLYVLTEDFGRLQPIEQTLRQIGTPSAEGMADQLRLSSLAARDDKTALNAYLNALAARDDTNLAEKVSILRTKLATGEPEAAEAYLETLLSAEPNSIALRYLKALLLQSQGKTDDAITVAREILDETPQIYQLWIMLIRVYESQGQTEAAQASLAEGLEVLPDNPDLLWAKASYFDQAGDSEGAIEIYEDLYARNTSSLVVANNLASLLSTTRSDPEDLTRAYQIARRLRGSDVPAFQDTYGWIAFQRGDYEDALRHLEPAAEALSREPKVQYHLARTYEELRRFEDAQRVYLRMLDAALPGDSSPQLEDARNRLQALRNAAAN